MTKKFGIKQMPTTQHQIEDFHFQNDFGLEAQLPSNVTKWSCENITKEELKKELFEVAHAVNPLIEQHYEWMKQAKGSLLEEVLGDQPIYNISQSLDKIRQLTVKSSQINLVRRCLALLCIDLKMDVQNTALLTSLYTDLCFTDEKILPEARKSNAVSFYSFCLLQNDRKRIRLHYVYPSSGNVQQDQFPHDHYGHASSILLYGSLVNQFFSVHEEELNPEYSLYKLTRDGKRRAKKRFVHMNDVSLKLIGNHCYKAGQQYFLPSAVDFEAELAGGDVQFDSMMFHQIGTNQPTVTLFCMEIPQSEMSTVCTFPVGTEKVIERGYTYNETLSIEEATDLVINLNEKILHALSEL